MTGKETKSRVDVYARITDRIVADLERGVRPWIQPWSAANGAGRITRPLRHNGLPYQGINVVLLWSEAVARGFSGRSASSGRARSDSRAGSARLARRS